MRTSILLVLLAACGKVSSLVDGSSPDGNSADANVNVTVTVLDPQSGAPVSGVPVVFTDTSGATLGHPTTATSGKVTLAMPGGGTITAVLPNGATEFDMQTVLGVKPGDAITLNIPPQDQSTTTYTVAFSAYGPATQYYVYGPCGGQQTTSTSTTLTIYAYCQIPAMDIIAVAYDANFNPLAYVERSAIAYSAGGSTTLPTSWQGLAGFTATATNLPTEVTSANVARYWPDEYGYGTSAAATITSTTGSASLSGPTSLMAVVETSVRSSTGLLQRLRQRNPGTSTAYNLDVGNNLLAWVDRPTLDVTTGKITTAVTGTSHGAPDLFAVFVSYGRSVGGVNTTYAWTVYAPDTMDITLPTLPPEVGDVGPKTGDSPSIYSNAALVDYDSVQGYDVARQNPTATLQEYFSDNGRGPSTARYSQSPLLL
jgi:hypothetical protein